MKDGQSEARPSSDTVGFAEKYRRGDITIRHVRASIHAWLGHTRSCQ